MASPGEQDRAESVRLRRRPLLALMGAGTVSLSSGCLDFFGRDSDTFPTLGWVAVKNYHSEPHRLEIQIERDDTVVHESTHEIDGKPAGRIPGDVLECTWGDEPGPYILRGRVADGEWVERSLPQVIDESASMDGLTECVIAEGAYGRYGSPRFGWLIQDWCEEVPTYEGGCGFANS